MEEIRPPADGSAFGFWGTHGRLPSADGLPTVELCYRTEPPHGDFLYSLEIDGAAIVGDAGIRVFWGRNVIVSPCEGYVALTELSQRGSSYSIFNLRALTEQSRRGFFNLRSLVYPILAVQPCINEGATVKHGAEKRIDVKKSRTWKPVSRVRCPSDAPITWPPWANP